jgi:CRP/FNR family cyclic AMP-dependent transcriptional regulator
MASPEVLHQVDIFSELAEEDLRQIAALGRERSLVDGAWVFEAGSPAAELYVLLQGRVQLSFDLSRFWDSDGYLIIENIEPNHIFGWSALVPPHEMTLSARCVGPCNVLALPREGLQALFECDREMGYRVMKNLSQLVGNRLRVTRQKLILEMGTTAHLQGR